MYRNWGLVVCGVIALGATIVAACGDSATHNGADGGAGTGS
jgi:hypothetical protein